jgi:hypothetical protein
MAKGHYPGPAFEIALRSLKLVQSRFVAFKTTRQDVKRWLQEEFQYSDATAYRHAACVIDVLLLDIREIALYGAAAIEENGSRQKPGLLSLGIRCTQVPRPMRGPGGD